MKVHGLGTFLLHHLGQAEVYVLNDFLPNSVDLKLVGHDSSAGEPPTISQGVGLWEYSDTIFKIMCLYEKMGFLNMLYLLLGSRGVHRTLQSLL